MPQYLIERTIPGAGRMSADELRAVSAQSVGVLRDLGPDVQWAHSYVVDDKIYCLYNAADADLVREHARCGGFPADLISEVRAIIDPVSAEAGPLTRAAG